MAETINESKANAISDEEREFAQTALNEFNKKHYSECIKALSKLESTILPNNKFHQMLIHNKSVAEFYKNDLKKYDQFEKVINQIVGKADNFTIKDPEKCVPCFNLAIILFHLRKPIAALKILTEILKHIDNIDESVVQKIGLLTINLLLDSNKPKQAEAVLDIIQNRLGISKESWEIGEKSKEKSTKAQDDFKKMFKFCYIRTCLLNGKSLIIPLDETSDYSILKAHQYYLGNDYQMAAKELSKKTLNEAFTVRKHGDDQNTCLANNMGLIHFSVRHYAMAVRFFQHALTFDQSAAECATKDSPLYCIGASKRPDILYNLGIALLHLQRPKEAFECLLVPLNYHHNNPKLWLRLAEACIMVHKQNNKQKENKNIISSVIGSGVHRKYVIQPSPHKYISDEDQSFAIPSPNLEFACLCLRNAMTLVDYFRTKIINQSNEVVEDDSETPDWNKINEGIPCNPSKALTNHAFDKLKCAVLAAYSYVLISNGEYTLSLKYSKELLTMKNMPDTHKMLGHLYCAESLIMMDRVAEAKAYLEPKLIKDLKSDDFETSGSPDWNINSLEAAQSVMNYNLGVTYLIQGELELAKTALISCKHPIVFSQLKLLKMYMELEAGNLENCRIMIRLDTPHYL